MAEMSRRLFLKLTAAGGAALSAGLGAKNANKLIPYVIPPEEITPGVFALYATTCRECPAGCGMHLRHRDGRVVKAEGNADHPVNLGGLCPRGQSCVQGLYDPDRLTRVIRREVSSPPQGAGWEEAFQAIGRRLGEGSGRVILISDLQTGALAEVMQGFADAFGPSSAGAFGLGWPVYFEPFNYEPLREAHEALFGQAVVPEYRLDRCKLILSFAADFLETWVSPVAFARQFAEMHQFREGRMGRMVYVGPRLSMTAANADEFLQVPPGAERWVAMGILKALVEGGRAGADAGAIKAMLGPFDMAEASQATGVPVAKFAELAHAFAEADGSVALAGPVGATGEVARETALAAGLLNHAAGRIGQTVDFSRPHALGRTATTAGVASRLDGLTDKDVLIVHNANLAYAFPGAAEVIRRAGLVIYLGTMPDETAELANWVLPVDSPLEAFGDYEPAPGVHGLMQPTLARLYDTRPAGDVLLALAEAAGRPLKPLGEEAPAESFLEWLQHRWERMRFSLAPRESRETFWREGLRRGGAWGERATAAPLRIAGPEEVFPVVVKLRADVAGLKPSRPAPVAAEGGSGSLWVWPSVLLFDGRVANRGWLQEAPEPVSYLGWGTWIDVHPARAKALGLSDGDVVALATAAGQVEAPVRVTDDVSPSTFALAFGQGHTALGQNAKGLGANAFALLARDGPAEGTFGTATLRKTGRRALLIAEAATQEQHHREILQWVGASTLGRMKQGDGDKLVLPLPEGYDPKRDLYPAREYKTHRWAMVIDLARCIGCGACAVACYAENNIPVAGAVQVRKGREMAWLKIVPYRRQEDARRLGFLPMLCQHCDAAPCEPVCPVFAAVHNEEGLNAQVYNRCIGTRYCNNNCPYKVRRFNWFDPKRGGPLDWQLNPDVSARSRGVMEKCTFCIQRIRDVEHRAKREDRPVRDGEVQPACAQSCPTRAIIFGDLLDGQARVTELTRRDPRRYHVLEELNTKPAVTYLRRVAAD